MASIDITKVPGYRAELVNVPVSVVECDPASPKVVGGSKGKASGHFWTKKLNGPDQLTFFDGTETMTIPPKFLVGKSGEALVEAIIFAVQQYPKGKLKGKRR